MPKPGPLHGKRPTGKDDTDKDDGSVHDGTKLNKSGDEVDVSEQQPQHVEPNPEQVPAHHPPEQDELQEQAAKRVRQDHTEMDPEPKDMEEDSPLLSIDPDKCYQMSYHDWSDVDIQNLINLRCTTYKENFLKHTNKNQRINKLWNKVAYQLHMMGGEYDTAKRGDPPDLKPKMFLVQDVRTKWQYLASTYKKKKSLADQYGEDKVKWKWYKFLKEFFKDKHNFSSPMVAHTRDSTGIARYQDEDADVMDMGTPAALNGAGRLVDVIELHVVSKSHPCLLACRFYGRNDLLNSLFASVAKTHPHWKVQLPIEYQVVESKVCIPIYEVFEMLYEHGFTVAGAQISSGVDRQLFIRNRP